MSHAPARKQFLGWNRLLCAHYVLGVLAGLLMPAGLSNSGLGRSLLAVFPVLGAISSHSADRGVWGSYFVLMLLLSGALAPIVAIKMFRDARPSGKLRVETSGALLALLFAGLLYLMLLGSAGFWTSDSFQGHNRADVLGRFLLQHRLGLALVGSFFMSLAVFFAALVAVLPLIPLKSPGRFE